MKKNKGFTLIELLVVIAIIGILASVVLASLNSARDKGANASIKSNLVNMRAQAALVFDDSNPNSYETLCSNSNVTTAVGEAEKAAGTAKEPAKAQEKPEQESLADYVRQTWGPGSKRR